MHQHTADPSDLEASYTLGIRAVTTTTNRSHGETMDDPTTTHTIELQLVDVTIRHELERTHAPIDATDLSTWDARRYWRAITTLWDRGDTPNLHAVHDQLCTETSAVKHPCSVAADLMFLPLGHRIHVDDYIAVIRNAARRRRLATLLGDAADSIANGADPDAVLARLTELAS